VDKKVYNDVDTLRIPAQSQNVEINYTAPSLLIPQRVRFRYKLEGLTKTGAMLECVARHSTRNCRQGRTRSALRPATNDGVWSEAGASFAFSIPPSFTQSVLFKASLHVRCFWAAVVALHNTAAAVHRTGQSPLYERLAERTRIARELHDTLLQSFSRALTTLSKSS